MKYFSDNQKLHIRFSTIQNYFSYSKLFEKFSISISKSKYLKSIDLNLDSFTLYSNITNKFKLFLILYDFQLKLSKIGFYINDIEFDHLIVLKHQVHKYFILGANISPHSHSILPLHFNIHTSLTKQIRYLIIIPICNLNMLPLIESFFFSYQITIFTSSHFENTSLPIYTIPCDSNLQSYLHFMNNHLELLSYFDIVVIFDNTFFENIFQNDFLLSLDNFLIVGNISNISIMDSKYKNIRDLFPKITSLPVIYNNYTQIIFSSFFLQNNIKHILNKNIDEISIICKYME